MDILMVMSQDYTHVMVWCGTVVTIYEECTFVQE